MFPTVLILVVKVRLLPLKFEFGSRCRQKPPIAARLGDGSLGVKGTAVSQPRSDYTPSHIRVVAPLKGYINAQLCYEAFQIETSAVRPSKNNPRKRGKA